MAQEVFLQLQEVEKAEEEVSRSSSQALAEEIAAQPILKFGAPLMPIIEFEEDTSDQDANYSLQANFHLNLDFDTSFFIAMQVTWEMLANVASKKILFIVDTKRNFYEFYTW